MASELSALRAEKAKRDGIANQVPAMIGYWNRDLRCEFANAAYIEWFGLTPQRAMGMHLRELLGEKLFKLNEPHVRLALRGEGQRFEREILKPDGSIGYTDARYIPDVDEHGNIRGFSVLVTDITELHRAYEKIRELAHRLESAREDERRSLARVLHEGIAQDLFAMKLDLEHLYGQSHGRSGVTQVCRTLTSAVAKCMDQIRSIAVELRPPELDNMHVDVAIEHYAAAFGEKANIDIHFHHVDPLPELNEELKMLLFRAAQEALTNVARHAQASRVEVTLSATSENVLLAIVDNGVGISFGSLDKPRSLGIVQLRERAESVGGTLSVSLNPGAGTALTLDLPLHGPNNDPR